MRFDTVDAVALSDKWHMPDISMMRRTFLSQALAAAGLLALRPAVVGAARRGESVFSPEF